MQHSIVLCVSCVRIGVYCGGPHGQIRQHLHHPRKICHESCLGTGVIFRIPKQFSGTCLRGWWSCLSLCLKMYTALSTQHTRSTKAAHFDWTGVKRPAVGDAAHRAPNYVETASPFSHRCVRVLRPTALSSFEVTKAPSADDLARQTIGPLLTPFLESCVCVFLMLFFQTFRAGGWTRRAGGRAGFFAG
jgi:hypothetical protein